MRKPNPDRYPRGRRRHRLDAHRRSRRPTSTRRARAPERLDADSQKLLRAAIKEIWTESDAYPIYEGRIGASPREMRVALLDAAQSPAFQCLNPHGRARGDRRALPAQERVRVAPAGRHRRRLPRREDCSARRCCTRLLAASEYELYVASGLVDEEQYVELFDAYVQHVSVWVKKERLCNRVTQQYEEPDEKMMAEVERLLDVKADANEWRQQLISAIAAWAIDHPGQKVEASLVFPQHLQRMREAIFADRRPAVATLARDIVLVVATRASGLDPERRRDAEGDDRAPGRALRLLPRVRRPTRRACSCGVASRTSRLSLRSARPTRAWRARS